MTEHKFNKNDMERVGVFQEMGYVSIGDKYKPHGSIQFNQSAAKGKQILPGGSKSRTALQTGYFSDNFTRIMEAEAYTDPIKIRRQHRLKEGQRNIGKPFLPSSGDKQPSGLGSHYGTLAGPIQAFSPGARPRRQYKPPGKNFYTNPGKDGTGFGYVGVTIGSYHKHQPDEYDRARDSHKKITEAHRKALKGGPFKLNMAANPYFDENPYRSDRPLGSAKKSGGTRVDVKPFKPSSPGKEPAGMKAGTFDPYPSHSSDPYNVKVTRKVNVVNKSGRIFTPSAGPKSAPVNSVVNQNVMKSVNSQNYRSLTSVMAF